jgi:Fe-S cluster assembly protein SufD
MFEQDQSATMTTTMTPQLKGPEQYLADQAKMLEQPTAGGRAWLDSLRKRGVEAFAERGFPTLHDEAWRQTNLAPLLNTAFQPSYAAELEQPSAGLSEAFRYPELNGPEVIFHNGRLIGMNDAGRQLGAVKLFSLKTTVEAERKLLEAHLGAYASVESSPFVALNTAFADEGVVIVIPRNTVLAEPIHLLFLSSAGAEPWHAHPRVLVLAGELSQATIVETWGALDNEAVYFNNTVTELAAGAGAVLNHIKVQRESLAAFHIGTVQMHQERDSQVHAHSIALGGALVRNEVNAVHDGENVHCTLNGLYLGAGTQHIDNHTRLDHAKPHCTSSEVYKGILDDQASGVFTGRILVRQDAQKTDAIQSNRALLLTPTATINTQPQLEIFADDVRCTHGATVGQLNEEALFYLRTRGIGREAAEGLLTYAFANEIIEQLPVPAVRQHLEHFLASHFHITSGK